MDFSAWDFRIVWDLLEPSEKAFLTLLFTAPMLSPLSKQLMVGRHAEIKPRLRLIMSQNKTPVRTTLGRSMMLTVGWLSALTDFVLPWIETN